VYRSGLYEQGGSVRTVLQRVIRARVTVDGEETGAIGPGLLVLVGIAGGDTSADGIAAASKIAGMRIFTDDDGKMNRSVTDVGGSVLAVSQFTLLADVRKGRRPSFVAAARPETAVPVLQAFTAALEAEGLDVRHGRFGAHMHVELVNDGPVTIVLDIREGKVL